MNKFFKIFILTVFVLIISGFLFSHKVSAVCTQDPEFCIKVTWVPSAISVPWNNLSSGLLFTGTYTYTHDSGVTDVYTGDCVAPPQNGSNCAVNFGQATDYYTAYGPNNKFDAIAPVCGTWDSTSAPTYTLSGSYDAPASGVSGSSGINVAGGTCTVTSGDTCNVPISDNADNTRSCVSPIYTPPAPTPVTVTPHYGEGGSGTPLTPQSVLPGTPVDFDLTINSGHSFSPADVEIFGECTPGGYVASTSIYSATINNNCTINFSFPTIPTLSCAHDTNQAEPIYPNAGAKFRATGGIGTYSWSYSATPVASNATTGIEVWPAWTDSGTKTATVTSGAQQASCTVYITPAVTPINGLCATPEIHNNCASGVLGSTAEYSNSYQWWCNSPNGGTNDLCTEYKDVMSGTLSPSSSTCYIPAGGTTCTKLLTWTTSSPVAISAVTSATGTPSPGPSANNSSYTFTIPYNNGVESIFYLYNNGVWLAQASVAPYCVAGTEWDGNSCEIVANPLPDLTASAPTPNIATVNVARTFSSDISNIGGASSGVSFTYSFQLASAANGGGTIATLTPTATTPALGASLSRSVTSPSHTFTTAGTYSVRACADLPPQPNGVITESSELNNCSAWTNVTVSATAGTVTGYHDAYSGTVVASQCRADGWAAYSADLGLDLNIKILSDGVQVATGVASTYRGDLETAGVCTGGTCSFWINLSGLISNGTNHTITAQAQNPSTNAWVTLPASPKTINCTAPTTGTLTASNCTIAENGSSCNTALTWTTANPVGTSNITSNTPSSNTIITTGDNGTNFSASVPYSSRTFFLNNNSVPLTSATATATCVTGTSWDGSKCAVSAPTCTPTPSFNGSVSETTVTYGGAYTVSCDYGVISDSILPDVGSGTCSWNGFVSTVANFNCAAGYIPGTFENGCIINNSAPTYPYCSSTDVIKDGDLTVTAPPFGSPIAGSCGAPAIHYNCASPTPSINNNNGISSWTWTCPGQSGGSPASCVEAKKKPVIIED